MNLVHTNTRSQPTCIFMATSLPSFILARWTWPMDAAANGRSSKDSSLSLQLGPKSLFNAFYRHTHTHTAAVFAASLSPGKYLVIPRHKTDFVLSKNYNEKKRYVPSSVWLAWSQRSVALAQRSWPAEGWWRHHLKNRNMRLYYEEKDKTATQPHGWHWVTLLTKQGQTLLSESK